MAGELLRSAAARRDDSEIRSLLEHGARDSINLADKHGKTPLHLALEAKRDSTVRSFRRRHRGESNRLINLFGRHDNIPLAAIAASSTVQLLLGNGAQESINLADRRGKTPLHLAATAGSDLTVRLLLEKGAQESINLADRRGKTPLYLAARGCRDSTVQLLLRKGAQESINLADRHGKTPLHLAAEAGSDSTVQLLLEKGAQESINLADSRGKTPLHLAATAGHSTVQLLLEKGAQEPINSADEDGETPLHLAAEAGSDSTVQLLLEKGAQESINLADRRGKNPLHLAAIGCQDSTVQLLLEKGSQGLINLPDKSGKTPLHLAAKAGSDSKVRLLLEMGAEGLINLPDKSGKTPLHLAAEAGSDSTVRLLLEMGAEGLINLPDKAGKTPLHLAAADWSRDHTVIQLLLENGAKESVNQVDKDRKTPLHLAAGAWLNDHTVIQLLLENGAQESVNLADEDGKTPLHLAAADGHERTVHLLLENGAQESINLADEDGKTPLHLAAEAGHNEVVELLLAQNAVDLNPKDANGRTLLSWAAEHHPTDVVRALVANRITMNPDGSELLQQVLADRHENVVKLLLTEYFDNVARGNYNWLSDLRQLGLDEAEIMDLVMRAMADDGGPWVSANISNVPDPEATIDTTFHQSYCAHKRRNTQTGDHKEKNEAASFDRFSEYISREGMQRRVSLFCGLAGVLPSGPLSDFGLVSFLDTRESIKVIYSDHWVESQLRDKDTEDKPGKLTVPMRAEAKETTTAIQSTPPDTRLISQLHRALGQFINAAITLQQTGFCCDQFTVLTAPESTTMVHMNTIRFDVVLDLARDIDQLQHESLDDSVLFRSVSTRVVGIMETLFGTPPSLPSTMAHQLHLCSLTVQLLCLGIIFYAQAHAGKLHPSYLAEPLTRVEIRGSSHDQHDQPYIIAEQAQLACMGDLVGDQVFVFRMSTRIWPIGEDGSFLSATCEEIVDSWGPASLIMNPQEPSERIFGLVIRGGIIQPNGKPEDGVRLFHWNIDFGGAEPSPSNAFGYKDNIVVGATIAAPSSHLVTTEEITRISHISPNTCQHSSTGERAAVLDANRSRSAAQQSPEARPPAVQPPAINTTCPRDIEGSYKASHDSNLHVLGTRSSYWELNVVTANLQGGLQVLAQIGAEWQKQRGRSMKRAFVDRWRREKKLSAFELPLGLQISLCTGVARRVPLRALVREDLMDYVDDLGVGGWEDLKKEAKDAMGSKERFAEWSKELTFEQRTCVQEVFLKVLECLNDTGFDEDGKVFSILWPYGLDATRGVKVVRNEDKWLGVLEDNEWTATFAVATNLCLATTKHPCRGERKALWPGVKTLSTSMRLLQPPSDRNHSVVERQIENGRWYWNGDKNSRTSFSAQKSNGGIAELGFQNSWKDLATFASKQMAEDLRRRILQSVWDKMHSRGILVEANDAHHIGEEVFVVREFTG
ncbi:hypothetical protein CDV36_005607 [Fusarium kuroshium]|uniref:Uncharacterized protein n=1 Tax=Fusarium kuroshium TaxID=2010991 RepID=A0A3M2SAZ0_9HYPO|nr:hypothetical protein CDV36_005607 [Fusarium kuroshium]